MKKQKSTDKENFPTVKPHVPELEAAGIEVSPVGDLVAEMKQASAASARELSKVQNPPYCKINCGCGPCRVGQCGLCTEDGKRRAGADERYRQRYSEPYQDFPRDRDYPPGYYRERDLRRELAGRWVSMGGVWDTLNDAPVIHDEDEKWRFRDLEQYIYGAEVARRRDRDREYEFQMNMQRMQMAYMAFAPGPRFAISMKDVGKDEWVVPIKDGKKDE